MSAPDLSETLGEYVRCRRILPTQTVDDEDFSCAVVGSLNNLLGYPHGQESEWSTYISVEPDQVHLALNELIAAGL